MSTEFKFLDVNDIGWYQDGEHADGSQSSPPIPTEGVMNRVPYNIFKNYQYLRELTGGFSSVVETDGGDTGNTLEVGKVYMHNAAISATTFYLPTQVQDPVTGAMRAVTTGDTVRVCIRDGDILAYPLRLSANGSTIGSEAVIQPVLQFWDYTFRHDGTHWVIVATFAPLYSPNFDGLPTVPTITDLTDKSKKIVNSEFLWNLLASLGLGTDAVPTITDYNAVTKTGMYQAAATASNRPVDLPAALLNIESSTTASIQVAVTLSNTLASARMFWRAQVGGTWTAWRESAMLESPAFTGNPQGVTRASDDNSISLATTAFTRGAMALFGIGTNAVPAVSALNSVTNGGLNRFASGATNAPVNNLPGTVLSVPFGSGQVFQLANTMSTTFESNRLFWRASMGGSWLAWREVAMLDSPVFTNSPQAPTAVDGDSSKLLATTEFVQRQRNEILTKDISGDVTLTTNEAGMPVLWFTGTLTAQANITLPAARGSWTVYNRTTGGFPIVLKTASGTIFVTIPAGKQAGVICGGANMYRKETDFPDPELYGTVTVTGIQNISGTLSVGGNASFGGVVAAEGSIRAKNFLDVGYQNTAAGNRAITFYSAGSTLNTAQIAVSGTTAANSTMSLTAGSLTVNAATSTFNGNQVVTGNGSFNNGAITTSGVALIINPSGFNASIELGDTKSNTASTPYIDYHSGATPTDYDFRMIASGGNGTAGQGTMTFYGAALNLTLAGLVTAVTATKGDSSNQVATTAYVRNELGVYGLGGTQGNTFSNANDAAVGGFSRLETTYANTAAWNLPDTNAASGTTPMTFNLLTFGAGPGASRLVQYATEIFGNSTTGQGGRGRTWVRVKHDNTWYAWRELAFSDSPVFTGNVGVNGNLSVNGVASVAGEIRTTAINSLRMIYGNYGAFWRNDGANLWLMMTNSGDQLGSYNDLRPFRVTLATGDVTLGQKLTVQGTTTLSSALTVTSTIQTTNVLGLLGAPLSSTVGVNVGARTFGTAPMAGATQRTVNVQMNYGPDVTTVATDYRAYASFGDNSTTATTGYYQGYLIEPVAVGTNHTVTTMAGFQVADQSAANLLNVFGYRGEVNTLSGKTRWNLYMSGSAPNYLNANLYIGTATDDGTGSKLQVLGAGTFTTTNAVKGLLVQDTGVNGAGIQLLGNGSTTPSKFLRVNNGVFQMINSAYNAQLFTVNDAGNGFFAGTLSANGQVTANGALYVKGQTTLSDGGFTFASATLSINPSGLNGAIELGDTRSGTASSPYIDFHSGATATDYDFRIVGGGGNGNAGGGYLTLQGTTLYVNPMTWFYKSPWIQVAGGTAGITFDGDSGQFRTLRMTTNTKPRWDIGTDQVAEGGSNSGSNFYLNRFNDTGDYIDTPFSVTRSTGMTYINDLTVNKTINVTTQSRTNNSTLAATTAFVQDRVSVKAISVRFQSNGTWTCPAGVNTIWLSGTAGGGGGGGGGGFEGRIGAGGGGGGSAGGSVVYGQVAVTPGVTYTINIGGGGSAGSGGAAGNNGGNGGTGGTTSMRHSDGTTIITLAGGQGGQGGDVTAGAGGQGGGVGGGWGGDSQVIVDGQGNSGAGNGGMGGSGPFGTSGGAGRAGKGSGIPATNGTGYGAGGGGGGGVYSTSGSGGNGSVGLPGMLTIQY